MEHILNGGDPTDGIQKGRPHRKDLAKAQNDAQRAQWALRNKAVDEWERNRKKITFTLYDLRHTFCTALYDAGVDVKTAAYYMGHKNIEITMRIYTHLTELRKKQSAAQLLTFLDGWKPLQNLDVPVQNAPDISDPHLTPSPIGTPQNQTESIRNGFQGGQTPPT